MSIHEALIKINTDTTVPPGARDLILLTAAITHKELMTYSYKDERQC